MEDQNISPSYAHPLPLSKLGQRHAGRLKEDSQLADRRGERNQIIRRRDSLYLYKLMNTLCCGWFLWHLCHAIHMQLWQGGRHHNTPVCHSCWELVTTVDPTATRACRGKSTFMGSLSHTAGNALSDYKQLYDKHQPSCFISGTLCPGLCGHLRSETHIMHNFEFSRTDILYIYVTVQQAADYEKISDAENGNMQHVAVCAPAACNQWFAKRCSCCCKQLQPLFQIVAASVTNNCSCWFK